MQIVQITVKAWEKYNPRSDRANHTWFRFQNSFFSDPRVFVLPGDAQRLLIFCACEASKSGGTFELSIDLAAAMLRIDAAAVRSFLPALAPFLDITDGVTPPVDGVTPPNGGKQPESLPTTNGRTDERTDETDGGAATPRTPSVATDTTFTLPPELKGGLVKELAERRGLTERGLAYWASRSPSPQWFIEKLFELDLEADSHPSHAGRPFVQRVNEYMRKHIAKYNQGSPPGDRPGNSTAKQCVLFGHHEGQPICVHEHRRGEYCAVKKRRME